MATLNNWKVKTYKDQDYLKYIRTLECVVCGGSPCDAHHTDNSGLGKRGADHRAVPVCHTHHMEMTSVGKGKRSFEEKYDIDWRAVRLRCLAGYLLEKYQWIEDPRDVILMGLELLVESRKSGGGHD